MRFHAILATIVAFFSFALAQSSSSSSSAPVTATTTVTLTLYHANSTTTMTSSLGPTGGAGNYTSATTYATPTISASPTPPCDNCVVSTGAASLHAANVALIPFAGIAALAFSFL